MGDGYRSVDPATNNAVGCWTCRVRRKKCDNEWPVCQVCSALLITCHYNVEKPDWVDGGQRQQEMAEQLKQEVRDKAPYRRSLAYAKAMSEPEPTSPAAPDRAPDSRDRGFIACYLDFYFPFLFPFYRPSMLDRGRAWVLDFIADNQATEQATLSLSSYLFSLTLETGKPGHEKCKQLAWNKLLDQIHSTFMLLQEELRCLTAKDPPEHLSRMVPIVGCILMLQRFETTVSSFENCQAHLSAAIELLEQVLAGTRRASDQNGRESKF
ncbi:hypothetical protein NUW58_g8840 [Xylaria curta]|uniref:Uncharacterized protein n=1 Tax=Xylaria curta TaxID=42375 RepID=A0ACC1N435_9PEZI|nr:hypothetical protein NUW58_g8840 [Xylaria curta]